ncbi:hypothetical protein [Fodinibius salsisoli]|uniref:DUF5723 domain-containing protein n=1 Tax=Fodinibius salsisoli TaxID=2820877 RepID=A0ABT3PMD2_9BACT|nr:hypothetical protein [Fodinibius salsisoli]MCW9707105.1 hypothetical protein [Fodinibius salsisoli]
MKYTIATLSFLLLFTGLTMAQHTTGFSDPDDIQQLLEYQLPDWGYSNFLLDFSSGGSFMNSLDKDAGPDQELSRRDVNFIINPQYNLYRESERRILEFDSNVELNYGARKDESLPEDQTVTDRSWESNLGFDLALREYIAPSIFVIGREDLGVAYRSFSEEERIGESLNQDEERFRRNISSETRLGIGIGRVRNVSPVIRALRLKERYGVLTNSNQWNNEEIRATADIFTKYDGYQQRYERPEKHFWQAMDEATSGSISALEAFDMFYLTDVLDESIGQRLEGWELSGGGVFDYRNSLSRIDTPFQDPSFERSISISKNAGAFIEGRWFNNLSLNHQLGFSADASRTYPLDANAVAKWNTDVRAELSWLWNLADRFLMNTQLSNLYNTFKREDDGFLDGRRSWYNRSQLSSSFIYFIENRLAFNVAVRYSLNYNSLNLSEEFYDKRDTRLSFSAGVKYYFSRNLY